jgi:hypothetical protein
MKRLTVTLLLAVLALAAPAEAQRVPDPQLEPPVAGPPADPEGDLQYPELDAIASRWALRAVRVDCPSSSESWQADWNAQGAWAYTPISADWTRVDPSLCAAAEHLAHGEPDEPWREAMAVLAITHEAWHLRFWRYRYSERRVECKAIQHFIDSALMLTHDVGLIGELWPWALAQHYYIAAHFPTYNLPSCRVQGWPWPNS